MKIEFFNQWTACSLRSGGAFPITVLSFYADIHNTYKFCSIMILNFGIGFNFSREDQSKPEVME